MTLDVIKELMQSIPSSSLTIKGKSMALYQYLQEFPTSTNAQLIQHFYPTSTHGPIYLN